MVRVTSNTIIPVRFSFYLTKHLFPSFRFRKDYTKTTELLNRFPTVHEPDVANTAEFGFYRIDSPHFSFSLFRGLYLHISIILVQNILMNY